MTTDPDIRTPADYVDAEAHVEVDAEPSQQAIDEVYSLADAARAVGAWSDEES